MLISLTVTYSVWATGKIWSNGTICRQTNLRPFKSWTGQVADQWTRQNVWFKIYSK